MVSFSFGVIPMLDTGIHFSIIKNIVFLHYFYAYQLNWMPVPRHWHPTDNVHTAVRHALYCQAAPCCSFVVKTADGSSASPTLVLGFNNAYVAQPTTSAAAVTATTAITIGIN